VSDRPRGMDGILIVAKDPGFTSHDVVALVRRLTGTRRVGHGGTLDPFASGVLPVFLGLATRVVEYHMGDAKAYRTTVCFGSTSETDDRDGELVRGTGAAPTREAVESALGEFRGPIQQRRHTAPSRSAAGGPTNSPGRGSLPISSHGRSRSTGWSLSSGTPLIRIGRRPSWRSSAAPGPTSARSPATLGNGWAVVPTSGR